jgi:hypothetical protein
LKIRAEVSADRIELVKEIPAASKTMQSASGRLVLAQTSVKMDSVSALRVERGGFLSVACKNEQAPVTALQ